VKNGAEPCALGGLWRPQRMLRLIGWRRRETGVQHSLAGLRAPALQRRAHNCVRSKDSKNLKGSPRRSRSSGRHARQVREPASAFRRANRRASDRVGRMVLAEGGGHSLMGRPCNSEGRVPEITGRFSRGPVAPSVRAVLRGSCRRSSIRRPRAPTTGYSPARLSLALSH
jgi:hypothetical protein